MKNYLILYMLTLLSIVQANAKGTAKTQIVGGEEVDITNRPFQAMIVGYHPQEGYQTLCGASIINNRYVLTSKRCWFDEIEFYAPSLGGALFPEVRVVVGTNAVPDLVPGSTQLNTDGQVFEIAASRGKRWGYSVYGISDKPDYNDDIMLLKLDSAMQFNSKVQPIRWLTPELDSLTNPGVSSYVSGWGQINETDYSFDQLRGLEVTVITNEEALSLYEDWGYYLPNTFDTVGVLATAKLGSSQEGPGALDNGGPLTVEDNLGIRYLAGIVASRPQELRQPHNLGAANSLSIYNKVSAHHEWIPWFSCMDTMKVRKSDSIYVNAKLEAIEVLQLEAPFSMGQQIELRAGDKVEFLPGFIFDASTTGNLLVDTGGVCDKENIGDFDVPWLGPEDFNKTAWVAVKEISIPEVGDLSLVPNPAKGQVLISIPSKEDIYTIEVIDMSGQLVYIRTGLQQQQVAISAPDIPGLYLVQVQDIVGNRYTEKLTVTQ